MHDNNPEILETEKQKNLSGRQQKGSAPHDEAPGWNEYLASASEAAVKADKSTLEAPDEMAKRSVEHIRNRHHHDDGTHVTIEADYEKDEVEGPLRKSGKKT
ncbi:hypothetical protein DFH11DRAFT_1723990 [Phellopilus nigrolimitatus]|nr:hypothetical protein DFH11DRAFT_1723990 [Phellopilus nigrolimitatus]